MQILKGQTSILKASQKYGFTPSKLKRWVDDDVKGMENALRSKPKDIREQYEQKITDLTAAYGEAMLENKALKKLQALLKQEEH